MLIELRRLFIIRCSSLCIGFALAFSLDLILGFRLAFRFSIIVSISCLSLSLVLLLGQNVIVDLFVELSLLIGLILVIPYKIQVGLKLCLDFGFECFSGYQVRIYPFFASFPQDKFVLLHIMQEGDDC